MLQYADPCRSRGIVDNKAMRRRPSYALFAVLALALFLANDAPASRLQHISPDQARNIAMLLAEHEQIDVKNPDLIVDTMDRDGAFVEGYFSFILIRQDQHTAGADKTLGMFAVNARTGDAWEINLCKHYSFPELAKVQRRIRHSTGAHADDEVEAQKDLGCIDKPAPKPEAGG